MALASGARLGSFEVTGQIGAGGMGVVYRARDTKLKRDVAIKVLPATVARDPERLSRLQREAEVLASLNHPNIAQIYGLEESDGTTTLVLELVDGPTLADRIAAGPLPVDEALAIAMQIADALEAAHGQGIVHRDLKPANIKLKADGTVKVLDFGIAKALDLRAASGLSPVMETPTVTQTGIILGTAAYMSPEQARGKGVDQRTDIWAFGCVLYEMLTGQQAFGGEDVTVMLARILEREPTLDALPKAVSPAVRRTVALCLRKDPRKRVADIRDIRLALAGEFESEADRAAGARHRRSLWWRMMPASAGIVLGGLVAGFSVWIASRPPAPPVDRFSYVIPEGTDLYGINSHFWALAPTGRAFVYLTTDGIYLRELDTLAAHVIPGTQEEMGGVFFSPDGEALAYWAAVGQLKRVSLRGGAPLLIAENVTSVYGASWDKDGSVLYGQPEGIYRVPAAGGAMPELVVPIGDDGRLYYGPRLLPDRDSVLFTVAEVPRWDEGEVVIQSLSTGERKVVLTGGSDARYVPTGHLVYAFEDGLYGVAFDVDRGAVSGDPTLLVDGILRSTNGRRGNANYEISDDGTLAYVVDWRTERRSALLWVDREGREEQLSIEPAQFRDARISPDGTRAAISVAAGRLREADIWIYDLERGTASRLTVDPGPDRAPIWTPDGRRIVYVNSESGISWVAADGAGASEVLIPKPPRLRTSVWPNSFSPDGRRLVYQAGDDGWNLYVFDLETAETAPLIDVEGYSQQAAAISPDGRWIAYESDETGRNEIWVRPFPDVDGGKWRISASGGRDPVWSPDSHELFFSLAGRPLQVVSIATAPSFSATTPKDLYSVDGSVMAYSGYGISSDGGRFLMTRADESSRRGRPQITIVQNWFEELKRLVPAAR